MLRIYLLVSLALTLLLSSCDLINPAEQEPSWIHIDSISLRTNPDNGTNEGSLSHDITDAWVFIDDEMIGICELPTTIPVLDEGKHKLTIGPGIKVSTVSTLRDNYLFYESYTQGDFILKKGETVVVNPTVRYRSAAQSYEYMVVEDFEDALLGFEKTDDSDLDIETTHDPDLVYEGTGSGVINITAQDTAVAIKTTENFVLPRNGKVVYMELDYYTDYYLTLGVYVNNNTYQDELVDYVTLRPATGSGKKWKKAYVALTSVISNAINPENFYFYFYVNFQESGQKNGRVIIDNVKLLYQR